ncbi:membrane-flanked domain-containing protein [Staphylococcus piscifermentans]|uniref:Membrane protein n=1 Tax=Staphylococcus piscifermentans TaxID=70258 RepID=A0A239TVH2_9STAP|nr:PH domain-containing protein [Staphylococcus piscifermentans]RTX85061.1 hypothetical protein CD139_04805 [Staphylococcus piscifermentans]GEP85515.1 membrane protein [Staphylococcus piscifermentans]SNV01128.1 membrane-flanked domain-containing protein [Staphylococcus piscifermentans]
MFEAQKLHPISYISGLIKTIKQNFIVIILFFFNIQDFDYTDSKQYIWPAFLLILFLFSFIINATKVFTTRYWIEGHHFIITYGFFNKKRKEIDIQRIQSIDTSQDVVNRLFGGVILEIKVPSNSVKLEIVSKKQSQWIEQSIKQVQNSVDLTDETTEASDQEVQTEMTSQQTIFKLNLKELMLMSFTSGSIVLAILTLSPILGSLQSVIPWDSIFHQFQNIAKAAYLVTAMIIISILIIAYIIGVIIEFTRYFGYTLAEEKHQLKIKHGLLNVKSLTVPTKRIQAVIEKQSFIRRLLGYTSIYFVITSDGASAAESESASGVVVILPFMKRDKAYEMLDYLVPSLKFPTVETGLPKGGIRRNAQILAGIFLAGGIIGGYLWNMWALVPATLLIILTVINSVIMVRNSGMLLSSDELVVKYSQLIRTRYYYAMKDKLIGFEKRQNPFLRKAGLAHFNFSTAKGAGSLNIGLRFVKAETAEELKIWYLKEEHHEA